MDHAVPSVCDRQERPANAAELKQLEQWKGDIQEHLGLDWTALHADILGDTLVLAYSPGPKSKPEDERGLLLLHVRKPETLKKFISQLNKAQKASGELKSLTELQHKNGAYWRRVEPAKTQFYYFKDSLFAFSGTENLIKNVLDRLAAKAVALAEPLREGRRIAR